MLEYVRYTDRHAIVQEFVPSEDEQKLYDLVTDYLQQELDAEIAEGKRDAREKLLDNFDQEVVEKVKVETKGLLDRFNEQLWQVVRTPLFTVRWKVA